MKTLTDILYKYKNTKLEYGNIDCCVFTAKVVEEYFNLDLPLWKDLLIYDNYKDAIRTLRKNGIKSVEDLPTAILGVEKKPISEVKLGEPVYAVNEEGQGVLGVCNGMRAYFLHSKVGLMAVPIETCLYAWEVPNA